MSKTVEILSNRQYTLTNTHNNYTLMNDPINNENVIIFNCLDNITINLIKAYVKIMIDTSINHSIIVYDGKITPSAKKIIDTTELDAKQAFEKVVSLCIEKNLLIN